MRSGLFQTVERSQDKADSADPKLLPLDHSPAEQTRTVVRFEHK